jgi:hypothetical protein
MLGPAVASSPAIWTIGHCPTTTYLRGRAGSQGAGPGPTSMTRRPPPAKAQAGLLRAEPAWPQRAGASLPAAAGRLLNAGACSGRSPTPIR